MLHGTEAAALPEHGAGGCHGGPHTTNLPGKHCKEGDPHQDSLLTQLKQSKGSPWLQPLVAAHGRGGGGDSGCGVWMTMQCPPSLRGLGCFLPAAEQPVAELWQPCRALPRAPRQRPIAVRVSVPPRSQQHRRLRGHPRLSRPPPRHQQPLLPAQPHPPEPQCPPL